MMKFKKLSEEHEQRIVADIKSLLHAHRDCLRNQRKDTSKIRMDCRDGYYGEVFGIMRALEILGYGKLGAVNTPEEKTNLRWWLEELINEVLEEENYGGNNERDNKEYERLKKKLEPQN